jgi:hypothetical protein
MLSSYDGPGGKPIGLARCVNADNARGIASKKIGE